MTVDQTKAPDLADPRFKANPYPFYARLRAESPVYRATFPFWGTACLVTRYDDVLMVLKDERFANDWSSRMPWLLLRFARPLTRGMLNRDPPDHTRLRNLVQKAFTPRLIERLRERIHSVCDELLDAAAAPGRMEVVGEFALPLPITIIGDLLGISAQDRLQFHAWSRSMIGVSRSADAVRALPRIWALFRLLRKLFAKRRADPRDDLVTALVQAEESGDHLSEEELLSMVILLLIAGYETTTNLIAGGALALIQHPQQRERLRKDAALAESAVEELLRYTSPLEIGSLRMAREDVSFGSTTVARGELVAAVLGSANRDERQFPEPDTLDLAREPNRHLAFGQGPHFCMGAPLARLEGRIALTTLVRRFPDFRLAQPAESLRWRKSPVLRGLEALPVVL